MSDQLDFWFDFSCPYAYLASTRVESAASRMKLDLRPRPILLGGVLRALGVADRPGDLMPAPKREHGKRDIERLAALWKVPLKFPAGHPFRTVEALRALLAVGEPFMPLAHSLFRAYWVEGRDISSPHVLRQILQENGQDADSILQRSVSQEIKAELRSRTDEALAEGVFGVPTFRAKERLIWGVDRLYALERSLGLSASCPGEGHGTDEPSPSTFFFDYSSPFAAVASARVEGVLGDSVSFRPMLLGAVFRSVGTPMVPLHTFHEAKQRWARSDLLRQARETGFNLQWPSRFPMNTVL
ncbi:MAG: DsbA family protein, partial [Myxococcota bacterium]|nr:DsbA family protein [Myxococcota bacterium]